MQTLHYLKAKKQLAQYEVSHAESMANFCEANDLKKERIFYVQILTEAKKVHEEYERIINAFITANN